MTTDPIDGTETADEDFEDDRKIPSWTRRGLIAGAAAAGAGAAAALVLGAQPAGAVEDSAVLAGEINVESTLTTLNNPSGDALQGVTTADGSVGVIGVDNSTGGGAGVAGSSTNGIGVTGTTADGTSPAVSALNTEGIGVSGVSVAASGLIGSALAGTVGDSSTNDGVLGLSSAGNGVVGITTANSYYGIYGYDDSTGGGYGVFGKSTAGYGVYALGGAAPLFLVPASSAGAPTSGEHFMGELYTDNRGALFYCVAIGTPGTWIQVAAAGPAAYAQGAFCLLPNPIRLLDTRSSATDAADEPGKQVGPENSPYVLSVTAVSVGGVEVPSGAVAVIGNVTAVNATTRGFLTLAADGVTQPATSSLNFPATTAVANGVTVALSAAGKLDIWANVLTDVIFDATGFID
jgi:hypothetical protein